MGVYDSFVAKIICPYCGKEVVVEFQTKSLLKEMCRWRVGDRVETRRLQIKDGLVKDCIGVCPRCYKKRRGKYLVILGDAVIRDHRFHSIVNVRKG